MLNSRKVETVAMLLNSITVCFSVVSLKRLYQVKPGLNKTICSIKIINVGYNANKITCMSLFSPPISDEASPIFYSYNANFSAKLLLISFEN